jgi:hypothetical protein
MVLNFQFISPIASDFFAQPARLKPTGSLSEVETTIYPSLGSEGQRGYTELHRGDTENHREKNPRKFVQICVICVPKKHQKIPSFRTNPVAFSPQKSSKTRQKLSKPSAHHKKSHHPTKNKTLTNNILHVIQQKTSKKNSINQLFIIHN